MMAGKAYFIKSFPMGSVPKTKGELSFVIRIYLPFTGIYECAKLRIYLKIYTFVRSLKYSDMAEEIISKGENKKEKYEELVPQIAALLQGESDVVANMANVAAALKQVFGFFWVGFYVVKEDKLVLAPFQGPVACTRIGFGKGVCGTAWKEKQTQLVPDVDKFPGHIACSSASRSEIVVPILVNGTVVAVLDVDSEHLNSFDTTDARYLTMITELLSDSFIL